MEDNIHLNGNVYLFYIEKDQYEYVGHKQKGNR